MSFGASTSNTSGNTDTTALLNQLFNQVSNQSQTGTTGESSTGSTTTSGQTAAQTAKTLSPEQQAAESNVSNVSNQLSTNPQSFIAPAQDLAREQVNQNYAGLGDSLRQQFLSGEGGSSGKYGTAALAGDLARRAQLSSVDTQAAAEAPALSITGANLSQGLLNTDLGQTSTGTQTGGTQASGTQAGTSTGSGTTSTTGGSSSSGTTNATQGSSTNQAGGSVKI